MKIIKIITLVFVFSLSSCIQLQSTPLHEAVSNNDMVTLKKLIAKGADVNAEDNNGWTPLGL